MLFIFLFNDPATTEIYTLSQHDALPIFSNETVIGRVRSMLPIVRAVICALRRDVNCGIGVLSPNRRGCLTNSGDNLQPVPLPHKPFYTTSEYGKQTRCRDRYHYTRIRRD